MGVGFPEDLVVCVCLGVDMFDCVYPTRTARFGNALSDEGPLRLATARFKYDFRPVDKDCDCEVGNQNIGFHIYIKLRKYVLV